MFVCMYVGMYACVSIYSVYLLIHSNMLSRYPYR